MYPLFESIRILDGVPMHLDWHQERFVRSYRATWDGAPQFRIADVLDVPPEMRKGTVKMRFLYGREGFSTEYSLYRKKQIGILRLTVADGLEYPMKFTDRRAIDSLLPAGRDNEDILIVRNRLVSDTSFANIIFFDGACWYTPSSPLLAGTCRARLLDEGAIRERVIGIRDLQAYQGYKLINALRDPAGEALLPVETILPRLNTLQA